MAEHHLRTPISEADVRKLKAGDIIYVTGTMFTARDEAHLRALEYYKNGKKLPVDLGGLILYHCGPITRKIDKKWEVVAAGPTTSTRMESVEAEFMMNFDVRVVVGKGGMGLKTAEAMKKFGAIYCAFTGGTALLAARAIRNVERVEWLDLGMPEAIWVLNVATFGPLIVAIDACGNNLYNDVVKEIEENRKKIYRQISIS